MSGLSQLAKLVGKHFDGAFAKAYNVLVSYDPETAIEVDRETVQEGFLAIARKYEQARLNNVKAQDELKALEAKITKAQGAAAKLSEKITSGEIKEDDARIANFIAEMQADKETLPLKAQEAQETQLYLEEVALIKEEVAKNLQEFDAKVKKVMQDKQRAESQAALAKVRAERAADLAALKGMGGGSTSALKALAQETEKTKVETAARQALTDVQSKGTKDAKASADFIASLEDTKPKVSVLDQLKALSDK